ncbi:PepSY domain-containing protein [Vibrio sp. Y2-5]|uniref:PepSY domain-containing protein n=1 Tax=Vibrio TaxID=662 RepID=UPI00142DFAAA|nr:MULTISPECIES: PepSY domain-containing protein [Vibrio]MBD0785844.1 PepSY domain-containing protein [Vibrio sp. Y2-5]NIY94487.1 PepSY domain-containing protein [Vibrio diazotrophicus]
MLRSGLLVTLMATSSLAMASDPVCTKQPESKWMPFDQAKQQVLDMGYKIKKFKTTSTGCYELYGYNAEGKKAEIYFNPVDMSKVKEEQDD